MCREGGVTASEDNTKVVPPSTGRSTQAGEIASDCEVGRRHGREVRARWHRSWHLAGCPYSPGPSCQTADNHALAAANTDGVGATLADLCLLFRLLVIYPPTFTLHARSSPGSPSLIKSSFLSPPYPSLLPPSSLPGYGFLLLTFDFVGIS